MCKTGTKREVPETEVGFGDLSDLRLTAGESDLS